MRLGVIILGIAAIAVTLVHLRRQEIAVQHEIQRLQVRRVGLRRELARREVRIGRLTRPEQMQLRWAWVRHRRAAQADRAVALRDRIEP
jgi:hypothetical protein